MNCIYCGEIIDEINRSSEHVIQNALGGLLESESICCKKCNKMIQSSVDDEFCKIFSPILNQIKNLKKSRKSSNASSVGIALHKNDNEIYEVILKNGKIVDCIDFKRKYKKPLSRDDIAKFEFIGYKFELNNSSFKNGITKIAFNYAIEMGIPYGKIKDRLKVYKTEKEISNIEFNSIIIPFIPLNSLDRYLELDADLELYHNLILFNVQNILFCYVDLFNTFQFYVVLTDTWEGPQVYQSYLQLLEKIDRSIPDIKVRRAKHVLTLADYYKVEPTLNIEKLKRDIEITIKKEPYVKDMREYISNKISIMPFLNGDILNHLNTFRFYLNETEQLRVEKFRVYTPLNSNENQSIAAYPIEILNRVKTGLNVNEYTVGKFNRLSRFIMKP